MFKTVFAALMMVAAVQVQAAEVYKIDTKASTVAWKGTKKMGDAHVGGISVKEGEVTVNKGQLTAGNVVVDMTTITNSDVKDPGYNKKLVGHLSTEDFFNAGKFPTSTFKITSVAPSKTKGEVIVKGDFTMIGATHPIEFPAKVTVDKGVATGEAVVKIDRTKWGLKYGSGNFFKELAGDKIINDEFELTLKLVAKK
nr:YceI family protein [Bdellovibrio sp. CKG001]BFD63000.1 YceI family protein [Bdellovibrio sp. HM001]